MSERWRALVAATHKAQRLNRAHVQRLIGLLDLEPPLRPEALDAALCEEANDQRARALADLAPLMEVPAEAPHVRAAAAALEGSPGSLPRDRLAALRVSAAPRTAAVLDGVIARHDRFERRLGWLLRPSTSDELARLDPRADCNQIYHALSYEFRVEQKLFAVLFELAPVMIPYGSIMFASTGEFTLRAYKRINDTVMFFSNMIEWGLDSRRGREAVARVNQIHGRYSLPNELFRFILSGIMFIPPLWNQGLGWRRFTEVERLGWFHAFAEMGRAMNIAGISDDYDEMHAWWQDMAERAGETATVSRTVFSQILIQVLATYPAHLRRPLLTALLCGMPDTYRQVLDIPPPPAPIVASVREGLRLVGAASSALPRVPWIRSLQLFPMYRSVDEIGVGDRSRFMPRPPAAGPGPSGQPYNDGHATGQLPLQSPGEIPPAALPEISIEEVARHVTDGDAWLAIEGYVYDVTRFFERHPGGRKVLAAHVGGDATAAFRKVGHSQGAQIMMANFRIGRLRGAAPAGANANTHALAARPGSRIHTGRRAGRGKEYGPGDWDALLDQLEAATTRYERAKMTPGRDPDVFPLADLSLDPVDPGTPK